MAKTTGLICRRLSRRINWRNQIVIITTLKIDSCYGLHMKSIARGREESSTHLVSPYSESRTASLKLDKLRQENNGQMSENA